MEVLILLTACFLAVADTFTGALDCENIPLIAPFTLADERSACIKKLEGIASCA